KISNASRRQHSLLHHLIEIAQYLGAACEIIKSLIEANSVFGTVAKFSRVYAVKCRRLMEADERIGVVPVATGLIAPIDHQNPRVAGSKQLVGKSHRCGPSAYDKVISFKILCHQIVPAAAHRSYMKTAPHKVRFRWKRHHGFVAPNVRSSKANRRAVQAERRT